MLGSSSAIASAISPAPVFRRSRDAQRREVSLRHRVIDGEGLPGGYAALDERDSLVGRLSIDWYGAFAGRTV